MKSKNYKELRLIEKKQSIPLIIWILIILIIIFLLSMTTYFISEAFSNFAGILEKNAAKKEEIREFSSPIFQNGSPQETGALNNGMTTSDRSNSTMSNTSSATKESTTTNNNDTTQTDNNNSFIDETTETADNTAKDTVNQVNSQTGFLQPVISQAAGAFNSLFGN